MRRHEQELYIDCWEALLRQMQKRQPSLENDRPSFEWGEWGRLAPRERGVLAVIAALDLPEPTPAIRRHARMILRHIEQDGLLGDALGEASADGTEVVREEPLLEYQDMKQEQRQKLATDLRRVMPMAFAEGLSWDGGIYSLMLSVTTGAKLLKGRRAMRFLLLMGYPSAVLDAPMVRWMVRFGLLREEPKGESELVIALGMLEAFAHDVVSTLDHAGYYLSVHVGSARGVEMGDAPLCLAQPKCEQCALAPICEYGKFLKQHPDVVVREEKPKGRNLTESFLPEDRPREKLLNGGPDKLSNAELLAIMLRTGSGKQHAVEVANRLLRDMGSLERLAGASIAEITRTDGVGEVKAVTIKAALELARRIGTSAPASDAPLVHARSVFELLRNEFIELRKERFVCLLLNTKNKLQRKVYVSEGTLNQTLVHPREAFQDAVRDGAAAVIFVHNHPSGDPEPSRDDRTITRRLVSVGQVLGIRVLDHIIIGRETYYSFADAGELQGD